MSVRIIQGDCRDVLKTLPDESVHCVVTSPPYWGLRDYGTASWQGGDPSCLHVIGEIRTGLGMAALGQRLGCGGGHKASEPKPMTAKGECPHCGARRIDSQIGLEPTFDQFIAEMVAVFREVRRVLRSDGTLWLNLGDSYVSAPPGNKQPPKDTDGAYKRRVSRQLGHGEDASAIYVKVNGSLPAKNLLGIPWRVALALQADGWYLRQDLIWAKPNPMPESVTDRCTKAHEYIFLLSKSARYWYDAEAIKEPTLSLDDSHPSYRPNSLRIAREGRKEYQGKHEISARMYSEYGRNKRSVWEVATAPFSEAHFATFPPELIEPCIKAGCPKNGTVLDPFGGAGTTGLVADRLQRNAILIELNPQYAAMAERRIHNDAPLFASINEAAK